MTRSEKQQLIDELKDKLTSSNVVYLADTAELDAVQTHELRSACFKQNIQLSVVKNTLLKKAFEQVDERDFSELEACLSGPTSLMIADTGNVPAKLIKQLRKKLPKPILKGAWVEESVYVGEEYLDALVNIKSKDELLGEIVGLLQSPAKNVISALQSGGNTISGLVKALSERENN